MKKILWVRLAYWGGIIADVIAAILMIFPELDSRLFDIVTVSNPLYQLGVRRGSALMVGWAVLLFWADRKPVERRDVLLITLFPAVLGYIGYLIYALLDGFVTLSQIIPSIITEAVFIVVFSVGYLNAWRLREQSSFAGI